MKIILIAPRFHTNLYFRVIALQNSGYKIKVLIFYKGKSEYYKDVDIQLINLALFYKIFISVLSCFKKTYLKSNLELKLLYADKSLKKEIIKYKPDIILLKAYLDLLTTQVINIAKRFDINVVLLIQTKKNNIRGSNFLFKRYINYLKKHRVAAFITPILLNKIKFEQAGIKNIFYIPFVLRNKQFDKKYFNNNEINIISVGKFNDIKDQILLLMVFNDLKRKYKLHLTLIGEAADKNYLDKIKNYIDDNQLEDFVDIIYNLSYENILNEYKNHDLFVLPCYKELASYAIVEAMGSKLPVICSDACGTKCYIEEGKNGYVFKAKDFDSLKEKIELVIKDRKNLIQMGNNSFNFFLSNHSLDIYVDGFNKLIKLYNYILKKQSIN